MFRVTSVFDDYRLRDKGTYLPTNIYLQLIRSKVYNYTYIKGQKPFDYEFAYDLYFSAPNNYTESHF